MKVFKKIKKVLKALGDTIIFALSHKGKIADEAVDDGICDYTGQGK